jgi:hypothetical protein
MVVLRDCCPITCLPLRMIDVATGLPMIDALLIDVAPLAGGTSIISIRSRGDAWTAAGLAGPRGYEFGSDDSADAQGLDPTASSVVAANLPLDPGDQRAGTPDSVSAYFAPRPASLTLQRTLPIVLTATSDVNGVHVVGALFNAVATGSPPTALRGALMNPRSTAAARSYPVNLTGGDDGVRPFAHEYEGAADPNTSVKIGLKQFEDLEDVSVLAAPESTFGLKDNYGEQARAITLLMIAHSEFVRYGIAVRDADDRQSLPEVRTFFIQHDTSHAALYYPWIRILDPVSQCEINAPPSGFVAGVDHSQDFRRTAALHDFSLADLGGLAEAHSWSYGNDMLLLFDSCNELVDGPHVTCDAPFPGPNGLSVSRGVSGEVLVRPGIHIPVLANDLDKNTKRLYSVDQTRLSVVTTATTALGATVNINSNRTIAYDPTKSSHLQMLNPRQTAEATFKCPIQRCSGVKGTATVTVQVAGDDDTVGGGDFTTIQVPASGFTNALGIKDGGQVVGSYGTTPAFSMRGYIDVQGQFTSFDVQGIRIAKYQPAFPLKRFADLVAAREWGASFVQWYNNEHRHSGIRYVSPARRQAGKYLRLLSVRFAAYQAARNRNPQRCGAGRPAIGHRLASSPSSRSATASSERQPPALEANRDCKIERV